MSGTFRVGGFAHQHQHALAPQLAEADDVHHIAVDRGGVELEVARMNQRSERRVQRNRAGVGNGVVHMNELRLNCAESDARACFDRPQIGFPRQRVLLQFVFDDPERQRRSVNGRVDRSQNIRNCADVILVSVRQQDSADAVFVRFEIGDVGDDQIDARHIVIGKTESAIDDYHVVVVFHNRHVLADFPESAERNDPNLSRRLFFLLFGSSCHSVSFLSVLVFVLDWHRETPHDPQRRAGAVRTARYFPGRFFACG